MKQHPAIYTRQALLVGHLENIADALLAGNDATNVRPMFFSEFEQALEDKLRGRPLHGLLGAFRNFSPETKPVLRRMLITQAYLAQLILSTYQPDQASKGLQARLTELLSSDDLLRELSWTKGQPASEDVHIAGKYLSERLQWIHSSYSSLHVHS